MAEANKSENCPTIAQVSVVNKGAKEKCSLKYSDYDNNPIVWMTEGSIEHQSQRQQQQQVYRVIYCKSRTTQSYAVGSSIHYAHFVTQ